MSRKREINFYVKMSKTITDNETDEVFNKIVGMRNNNERLILGNKKFKIENIDYHYTKTKRPSFICLRALKR